VTDMYMALCVLQASEGQQILPHVKLLKNLKRIVDDR